LDQTIVRLVGLGLILYFLLVDRVDFGPIFVPKINAISEERV